MAKKRFKLRSGLEDYCNQQLLKYKIPFGYESKKFVLQEGFVYDKKSIEKVGKKFKDAWKKQQSITYTPDFIGDKWIIETKGYQRPVFSIKWKMFKKHLLENNIGYDLYKPHTRKQVDWCIKEILKTLDNEKSQKTNLDGSSLD